MGKSVTHSMDKIMCVHQFEKTHDQLHRQISMGGAIRKRERHLSRYTRLLVCVCVWECVSWSAALLTLLTECKLSSRQILLGHWFVWLRRPNEPTAATQSHVWIWILPNYPILAAYWRPGGGYGSGWGVISGNSASAEGIKKFNDSRSCLSPELNLILYDQSGTHFSHHS